jgi:nucleoside-diphosphate-sugar epimerase
MSSSQPTIVVFGLGAPSKFSPSILGRGVGGMVLREGAKENGWQMKGVARNPDKYKEAFTDVPNVQLIKGDVTNSASIAECLAGATACVFSVQAPDDKTAYEVDRDAVMLVAKECEKAGGIKFILISSILVSKKNRFNPIRGLLNTVVKWGMMDAKFEGEEFVRKQCKVRHTIIRPSGLTDGDSCNCMLTFNQGDSNFFGLKSMSKLDVAKVVIAAIKDPASDYTTFEVMGPKTSSPMSFEGVFTTMKKDQ